MGIFLLLTGDNDCVLHYCKIRSKLWSFSILGHRIPDVPYPAFGVYPSTKFALTAMTQTLRQEIGFYKFPIKLTVSPIEYFKELLK